VADITRSRQLLIATAVLLAVTALISARWGKAVLLVGGHGLPGWLLGMVPLLAAAVVAVIARRLRRRAIATLGTDRVAKTTVLPPAAIYTVVVLIGFSAVYETLWPAGWDLFGVADYTVLEPASPDGCVVVVRDAANFGYTSEELFPIPAGGVGRQTDGWLVRNHDRPVKNGNYRLTWNSPGDAMLEITGPGTSEVVGMPLRDAQC